MAKPNAVSSSPVQSYRPDIDGLRAVSILSVLIFHIFPEWLPGGFVGVDVFFVISGFLISNIIFNGLAKNHFSFSKFYSHRIRRIFPALILVLTTVWLIGWYVLLPDENKQLGKHIAGSAGFVENFILWQEAGYFDKVSESKPLMHFWSLGIEEQFYLIYPFIVWLVWRSKLSLQKMILLLGAISFGLNFELTHRSPMGAFYLFHTRFWELLAGGWLADLRVFKSRAMDGFRLANWFSFFGFASIVLALTLIDKSKVFPGAWPLLPVGGAWLLIAAGPNAWVNRQILSRRILVSIGLFQLSSVSLALATHVVRWNS